MSKKAFKSQASSSRAASGGFGINKGDGALGNNFMAFGKVASSPLSYVYEPLDLSTFSDPNITVAFKNVQKKDSTTKAKALEELQNYFDLSHNMNVEDAVLDAWVRLLGLAQCFR